ncbi:hypothetical protein L9F63_013316, partial [Diploptera punctata]
DELIKKYPEALGICHDLTLLTIFNIRHWCRVQVQNITTHYKNYSLENIINRPTSLNS